MKPKPPFQPSDFKGFLVGAIRFERTASRTPSECASQAALRPDYRKVSSICLSLVLTMLRIFPLVGS